MPIQPTRGKEELPPIIGLTGGVASGKSTVARRLSDLGAYVIDADLLGHEVLRNDVVRDELVAEFGASILLPDRSIDRRALAQLVFGVNQADSRRKKLESIVHPRIRELALARIDAAAALNVPPLAIVLDAPLLIEAGWEKLCDEVLFVDTPDECRLARVLDRGWTEMQFRLREQAQMAIEEKRHHATQVFDNSGSLSDLRRQVDEFWKHAINLGESTGRAG